MNSNEIDRALREERRVIPSPGFAAAVMRAVRHEAEQREGIAFPWRRFLPGLAASTLIIVVGAVAGYDDAWPPALDSAVLLAAVEQSALAAASAWIVTGLVATYLFTWWSMRLAGYRR